MKIVYLSDQEKEKAKLIADERNRFNINRKSPDKYGADTSKNGLELNIVGCTGEMSVAKYFGFIYNGDLGEYWKKDVGNIYQVRTTPHNNACLRLQKADKDNDKFILVILDGDKCKLMGWLYGCEGKKEEYWCDKWGTGRYAYWIPQDHLHDIENIDTIRLT